MDRHANRGALRASGLRGRALVLATSTGLAVVLAGPAFAQAQAAPPKSTAGGPTLEEIVVTAEKRAEPLQQVPISVQVVQGAQLQGDNNNSLEDVGQTLPAVHLVNTGNLSNTLNIRGVGSGTGNMAFEQSVATFVDDIYYGRARMIAATFLDLDRLEVLKGPQTTYFGNNAIAGALNITTKKPGFTPGGYLRALYGSYGTYAVEGAADLPVNDVFAVRVAGIVNGSDGWIKSSVNGQLAPHELNYAGRLTARFRPNDDFDATLKLEAGRNKFTGSSSPTPGQWTLCPPPSAFTSLKGINQNCGVAISRQVPLGLDNDNDAPLPGQFALLKTAADVLTVNYNFGGQVLTSVTGYNSYDYTANIDNAYVGAPVWNTLKFQPERYRQFSEEVRLASSGNGPIQYLVGAYYQFDRTHFLVNGNATFIDSTLAAALPSSVLALLPFPFAFNLGYDQREVVMSGFGAVTWQANDKLKVNLGLRGTRDDKAFTGTIAYGQDTQDYGGFVPYSAAGQKIASFVLGAPGAYPYSRKDSDSMGSVGVQYQLKPAAMLYATVSRGFKAGGFNAVAPAPIAGTDVAPTFGPEYVTAYEAGLKSTWLGDRLLVNLDLFREDYSDLQVNALVQLPTNVTIAVRNAASSISQGAELETKWLITPAFSITANAAYLDAHYVSYPNASPTFLQKQNKQTSQDLSGRPLDFAPKWSGAITAEYRMDLASDYRLTGDLTAILQSSYFNSNGTDDPNFRIGGSTRIDAKLTLDSPSRPWAIDLIGKNLTDAVIPVSFGTNNTVGAKQEPIFVAAQVRWKW